MMSNNLKKKIDYINNIKTMILEILLSLSVCSSIFSQLPLYKVSNYFHSLSTVLWIISLFYVIFAFGRRIKLEPVFHILPVLIFDFIIIIMQIFLGNDYLSSKLFFLIHLSAFIFLVSCLSGQFLSDKSFKRIINIFVLSVIAVSIYIFINYFHGIEWFSSTLYVYSHKNSFAQIVLFAAVLVFLYGFMNSNKLKYPVIFLLIFFLFLLKCRSTLVGFSITVLYVIFFHIKNFTMKVFVVIFLLTLIVSIFIIPSWNEFFIDEIVFNNRVGGGINEISSGRLEHFERFVELFTESPIIGNGAVRIESFPLSVLAGFGVIAGSVIIYFSISPLITCIRKLLNKEYSTMLNVLFIFTLISLSNSLFEEQAPFGPGVKCFFLWVVYGFFVAKENKPPENPLS